MKWFHILIFFFVLFFTITVSFAQYEHIERVISFDSEIVINEDATMLVTEIIKVYATGDKIKRGIYRDFPTKYKDNYGNNINIKFDLIEVLRDGNSEDFHTENLSNGIRVYAGRSDYYLPIGEYTYSIKYSTDRQIGYFDNFDELYWNVTGNDWDFIIESVSATVKLPANVSNSNLKLFGYTGLMGSTNTDYSSQILNTQKIFFKTTNILYPKEGFTIGIQWPKGLILEPSQTVRFWYFIHDNLQSVIGLLGVIALVFYYIIIWGKVGKDPAKGLIIPIYRAPVNLSAAAVRYIAEMGYDNKTFTSVIISIAVKGYVKIEEDGNDYVLIKTNGNKLLTSDEKAVYDKLLFTNENGKLTLELKQKNYKILQEAIKSLKASLSNSFEKKYFFTNRKYFIAGLLFSVLILLLSNINASGDQVFSLLWISFWSVAVTFLLFTVFKTWKGVLGKRRINFAALSGAIFFTLFSIPFVIGEFAGLYFLSDASSPLMILTLALLVAINIIFYHLLKAPTLLGRKMMDEIEGFKLYLGTAEKDTLESIKEPAKTPELFEIFLPFALALNVENSWAEKFSDVISNIGQESSSVYKPIWYSGTSWSTLGAAGFASSLSSSFGSAVSSSSHAPGSSSGGSGGSSGGGGGGGGGGGW